MTRTITTAAELDALPVGSVVVEGDHTTPDVMGKGQFATIPGVFHRFPDGWYVVAGYGARAPEEILPATVLHDPSAPAPASSVVPESAVEAGARAGMDDEAATDDCTWDGDVGVEDGTRDGTRDDYRHRARVILAAALPLLTTAPRCSFCGEVRDDLSTGGDVAICADCAGEAHR